MKMVVEFTAEEMKLLSKELSPMLNREDLFDNCMGFKYDDENGKTVFKGASILKPYKGEKGDRIEYNIRLDTDFILKNGIKGIIKAFKGIKFSMESMEELGYYSDDDIVFK